MSKVSIIVPNYNGSKYLDDAIKSVLNQTYTDWEMIIVDDCSTDDSVEIIKGYIANSDRIRLIALKNNNGRPSIPRNIAIRDAEGDYIAFLDSDDIWHSKKLELQISIMEEKNLDFSATELKMFHGINKIETGMKKDINIENCKVWKIDHSRLLLKDVLPTSSVIVKKTIINNLFFNEDSKYKAIEDYLMWLNILKTHQYCGKINQELLFYRLSETSISKSKFDMFKKHIILYSGGASSAYVSKWVVDRYGKEN